MCPLRGRRRQAERLDYGQSPRGRVGGRLHCGTECGDDLDGLNPNDRLSVDRVIRSGGAVALAIRGAVRAVSAAVAALGSLDLLAWGRDGEYGLAGKKQREQQENCRMRSAHVRPSRDCVRTDPGSHSA